MMKGLSKRHLRKSKSKPKTNASNNPTLLDECDKELSTPRGSLLDLSKRVEVDPIKSLIPHSRLHLVAEDSTDDEDPEMTVFPVPSELFQKDDKPIPITPDGDPATLNKKKRDDYRQRARSGTAGGANAIDFDSSKRSLDVSLLPPSKDVHGSWNDAASKGWSPATNGSRNSVVNDVDFPLDSFHSQFSTFDSSPANVDSSRNWNYSTPPQTSGKRYSDADTSAETSFETPQRPNDKTFIEESIISTEIYQSKNDLKASIRKSKLDKIYELSEENRNLKSLNKGLQKKLRDYSMGFFTPHKSVNRPRDVVDLNVTPDSVSSSMYDSNSPVSATSPPTLEQYARENDDKQKQAFLLLSQAAFRSKTNLESKTQENSALQRKINELQAVISKLEIDQKALKAKAKEIEAERRASEMKARFSLKEVDRLENEMLRMESTLNEALGTAEEKEELIEKNNKKLGEKDRVIESNNERIGEMSAIITKMTSALEQCNEDDINVLKLSKSADMPVMINLDQVVTTTEEEKELTKEEEEDAKENTDTISRNLLFEELKSKVKEIEEEENIQNKAKVAEILGLIEELSTKVETPAEVEQRHQMETKKGIEKINMLTDALDGIIQRRQEDTSLLKEEKEELTKQLDELNIKTKKKDVTIRYLKKDLESQEIAMHEMAEKVVILEEDNANLKIQAATVLPTLVSHSHSGLNVALGSRGKEPEKEEKNVNAIDDEEQMKVPIVASEGSNDCIENGSEGDTKQALAPDEEDSPGKSQNGQKLVTSSFESNVTENSSDIRTEHTSTMVGEVQPTETELNEDKNSESKDKKEKDEDEVNSVTEDTEPAGTASTGEDTGENTRECPQDAPESISLSPRRYIVDQNMPIGTGRASLAVAAARAKRKSAVALGQNTGGLVYSSAEKCESPRWRGLSWRRNSVTGSGGIPDGPSIPSGTPGELQDSLLRAKDIQIQQMERSAAVYEDTIAEMKSELLAVKGTMKNTEYINKMKIEKILQENTAYALKVSVLEQQFMEMNNRQRTPSGDDNSITGAESGESSDNSQILKSKVECDNNHQTDIEDVSSEEGVQNEVTGALSEVEAKYQNVSTSDQINVINNVALVPQRNWSDKSKFTPRLVDLETEVESLSKEKQESENKIAILEVQVARLDETKMKLAEKENEFKNLCKLNKIRAKNFRLVEKEVGHVLSLFEEITQSNKVSEDDDMSSPRAELMRTEKGSMRRLFQRRRSHSQSVNSRSQHGADFEMEIDVSILASQRSEVSKLWNEMKDDAVLQKTEIENLREEIKSNEAKIDALEKQYKVLNEGEVLNGSRFNDSDENSTEIPTLESVIRIDASYVANLESEATKSEEKIKELENKIIDLNGELGESQKKFCNFEEEKTEIERELRSQLQGIGQEREKLSIKLKAREIAISALEKSIDIFDPSLSKQRCMRQSFEDTDEDGSLTSKTAECSVSEFGEGTYSDESTKELKAEIASRDKTILKLKEKISHIEMNIDDSRKTGKSTVLNLRRVSLIQEILDSSIRKLSVMVNNIENSNLGDEHASAVLTVTDKLSLLQAYLKVSLHLVEANLTNELESARTGSHPPNEENKGNDQSHFDHIIHVKNEALKSLHIAEKDMEMKLAELAKNVQSQNVKFSARDDAIESLVSTNNDLNNTIESLQGELQILKSLSSSDSNMNHELLGRLNEFEYIQEELEAKDKIIQSLRLKIEEYQAGIVLDHI